MNKQRKGKCPLLNKYNYPWELDSNKRSDWYINLCEYCVFRFCIDDWGKANMLAYLKRELANTIVPCPKCEARDTWQVKTEDGLSCLHCGNRIYQSKTLKKTGSKFM